MAYTQDYHNKNIEEQVGAFSGYIRRPQPTISGMIAQFFGENGQDADIITALSLTRYQDALVYINVFLIKDPSGKNMKQDGHYPKIASFFGLVRRPTPNKTGMIAQFFAGNGRDADAVNSLGMSQYQDCLVYVNINGVKDKNSFDTDKSTKVEVDVVIDDDFVNKVTLQEKKDYHKKEKSFKKNNEILKLSGFLKQTDILYALGSEQDYCNWLVEQGKCAFPVSGSKCQKEPVNVLKIEKLLPSFNFLQFCDEHYEIVKNDYESIPNGIKYLEIKQIMLMQEWAWDRIVEKFSLTGNEEPDPLKIIEWSNAVGLSKYLPQKYLGIV